jgi:hypothetical protein
MIFCHLTSLSSSLSASRYLFDSFGRTSNTFPSPTETWPDGLGTLKLAGLDQELSVGGRADRRVHEWLSHRLDLHEGVGAHE